MRLHRFYINSTELKHNFWLHDKAIIHQWFKVFRYRPGQQVVLFDGLVHERLYEITQLDANEARLQHITDFERQIPSKELYLCWSLLKKDKNDWVLQKGTELGVRHFIPILAEKSEKTGFNIERAERIVIEASEQCGRSDIPSLREPILLTTIIEQLKDSAILFVCEQGQEGPDTTFETAAVFIGPEGGWSDSEKEYLASQNVKGIGLSDFTLRAETACVAAATQLLAQ